MTKEQAEFWVKTLTELLTDKNLTSVFVSPISGIEVRHNQEFRGAYLVEYQDGSCSVALHDSYGAFTETSDWRIEPGKRTIHARTLNGYGELILKSWAVVGEDEALWKQMKLAQKESWKFPYHKVTPTTT